MPRVLLEAFFFESNGLLLTDTYKVLDLIGIGESNSKFAEQFHIVTCLLIHESLRDLIN
jgi:hypothetical protein